MFDNLEVTEMLKITLGKVEPKIGDKVYYADDLMKLLDANRKKPINPGEVIALNKCSRELELEWIVVKWNENHIEEYREEDLMIIE
jgi:hypothetical protein